MNRKQAFARNARIMLRDYLRANRAPVLRTVPAGLLCSAAMLAAVPTASSAAPATYAPCINTTNAPVSGNGTMFTASIGSNGSAGGSSSFEGPGHAGTPGGPGSDLSYVVTSPLDSVSLFSQGGTGGEGSDAGTGDPAGSNGGGVGMPGGIGGTVGITTSAPTTLPNSSLFNSAVCAYSAGGTGGAAGISQNGGPQHASGSGGGGGDVNVTVGNAILVPQGAGGVIAQSVGGNGADGKTPASLFYYAGDGGTGASSGTVTVTNNSTIVSDLGGITAASVGGNGGAGGSGGEYGGNGGAGGAGNTVTAINTGSIVTSGAGAFGINAYSFGGMGGASGGESSTGGAGGSGGAGGTVNITLGQVSSIKVVGQDAPGVLAQSIGGPGAPGGSGDWNGGVGGSGGDGGTVSLQGAGKITMGSSTSPQSNSQGILAQSIGGGGGNGGDVNGALEEIGGNGGAAANGGAVSVNLQTNIQTYGDRSQGILAQSIGKGGGNGGNVTGLSKLLNLAIGGSGSGGGDGGPVTVAFGDVLQTNGAQSPGMLLQSIGGGGGSGGAAVSIVQVDTFKGLGLGIAAAIGGSGGTAGDGGSISQFLQGSGALAPTNAGLILTTGADSTGILAQSVGEGGGKGGGTSSLITKNLDKAEVVASYSAGGTGGGGGSGGDITLQNSGMILTEGAGSRGMHAQSVGGGGGDGGDASAAVATSGKQYESVTTLSVGGMSGNGGNGGQAMLTNSGLIITTGADGDGLLAQSIGGGGGSSGVGDAGNSPGNSLTATLGSATQLGSSVTTAGGNGGAVGLTNNDFSTNVGSILTLGDGAAGMLAQSIGDGGGRVGGGAVGAVNGGSFSTNVTLGASAGAGSSASVGGGPTVLVVNSGAILTFGADAPGILAQSVGGGGGVFGKGASSLGFAKSTGDGGNGSNAAGPFLASVAYGGVGYLSDYSTIDNLLYAANQLVGVTPSPSPNEAFSQQLADLAALNGSSANTGAASSLNINLQLGASGTGVGSGGVVQVTNNGQIATTGRMSTGLLAQSIGAGGGVAGIVNTALTSSSTEAQIDLGGAFINGDGGSVGVLSTPGSNVYTTGSLAPAIVAQSIGGGGGMASLSAGSAAVMNSSSVELGGIGYNPVGSGSSVTVTNGGGISTLSHDSPGIIAQSIGGGGGLVRLLPNDLETSGGSVPTNSNFAYNLSLGGTGCLSGGCAVGGNAGPVTVTHTGDISTQGNNAHGVLAQSIGGGGGAVLGGLPNGSTFLPSMPMVGNGGDVNVTTGNPSGTAGGGINTAGQGAVGVLAQSIGGGGGIAGDLGLTAQLAAFPQDGNSSGNGGTVTVTDYHNSTIVTKGNNAPAILAQSIGGGGGRIVNSSGTAFDGTFGGTGSGGPVTVNVQGEVSAGGLSSPGIFAESTGASGSPITVTVSSGGTVYGGTDSKPGAGDGAAIYLVGGGPTAATPNVITIQPNAVVASNSIHTNFNIDTAIFTTGNGYTSVVNAGTITGNVYLNNVICDSCGVSLSAVEHNDSARVIAGGNSLLSGSGSLENQPSGTINSGNTLGASLVRNDGTIDVGGAGTAGARTEVTGNLVQSNTGRTIIDSDHVAGISDRVTVDGDAMLAGALVMRPSRLSPTTVDVMDVKGSLDSSQLKSADPMLVHYQLSTGTTTAVDGGAQQSIFVTPQARFDSAAMGLGRNAQSVASYLQANFNAGSGGLGVPLAQLAAGVQDPATYKATLTGLGNEAQQAVGVSRLAASQAFVERMNSCPTFDQPQGSDMKEHDCSWGRAIDNRTTASGSEHADYSADTHSLQVGGQRQIADGWFLGGSAAYDSEGFNSTTGAGSVNGNGGALGVVLKREIGNWTISGAADVGYGSYNTVRNVAFPGYAAQATGSFNLSEIGLHSRIAYLAPRGDWYLKPYVDLHAVYLHSSGYSEQGAGALGLNVSDNGDTMYSASPMLEVGGRVELDNGMTMRPYAAVGAVFHSKNEWGASAQFQGAALGVPAFDTAAGAPTSLANVRLGVNLMVKKNLEVRVEYAGQFGSGYRSNEGVLRLNYLF